MLVEAVVGGAGVTTVADTTFDVMLGAPAELVVGIEGAALEVDELGEGA